MLARTIWAPAARTSAGERLFTVPSVATGMKAGVSTAPWAVRIRPRRAAPSVPMTSKPKARIARYTISMASPYE